jgi:hypothetical protein
MLHLENFVYYLKQMSPKYPEVQKFVRYIFIQGKPVDQIWLTTIVEFVYNDIRFSRHHVESVICTFGNAERACRNRLMDACERTISNGVPCSFDDIIELDKK